MNNTILNGGEVLYYAVKMNGTIVGEKVADRSIAESTRVRLLTENSDMGTPVVAEVVQVTASGQEVLFG